MARGADLNQSPTRVSRLHPGSCSRPRSCSRSFVISSHPILPPSPLLRDPDPKPRPIACSCISLTSLRRFCTSTSRSSSRFVRVETSRGDGVFLSSAALARATAVSVRSAVACSVSATVSADTSRVRMLSNSPAKAEDMTSACRSISSRNSTNCASLCWRDTSREASSASR
eukprot:CAMPEP_0181386034 /NCGR_PEP_ID=MMETSP1106-20121128/22901_1 /TAXON_ID=81844 /ORGANISM="Mantoniella antarctica, Strain SL-175" /LENGTH=170 /DNA_ID=CAMNT_0023506181 /DNA_START=152 /DNA_END=661 /DNA_ORIENTATION=+